MHRGRLKGLNVLLARFGTQVGSPRVANNPNREKAGE